MKVSSIAFLLDKCYNGRSTDDAKISAADMKQFVHAARGEAIYKAYREAMKDEARYRILSSAFLTPFVTLKIFDVKKLGEESSVKLENIFALDGGTGVVDIRKIVGASCSTKFYRVNPGTLWQADQAVDATWFEVYSDEIRLTHLPDCAKQLEIAVIEDSNDSNDIDVPNSVAWTVIKSVWDTISPNRQFPMDVLDNYNNDPKYKEFMQFLKSPKQNSTA